MGPKISTLRFQDLGPIKRPLTASNQHKHHKTLKSSRIKPLPHGVCRNSSKPVLTHCPRRVERLSFLLRRNSTVRLTRNLEKSCSLSLSLKILRSQKPNFLHLFSFSFTFCLFDLRRSLFMSCLINQQFPKLQFCPFFPLF